MMLLGLSYVTDDISLKDAFSSFVDMVSGKCVIHILVFLNNFLYVVIVAGCECC